jgi:tetratricopeptide (TPR) repeat protein
MKKDSTIPEIHIILGNIASEDGDIDNAIKRYLSALDLYSDLSKIQVNLAQAYIRAKDHEKAETILKAVIEKNFKETRHTVEMLKVKDERGIISIEKFIETLEAHLSLANIFYKKGQINESNVHLDKIISYTKYGNLIDSGNLSQNLIFMTNLLKSKIYFDSGMIQEALIILEKNILFFAEDEFTQSAPSPYSDNFYTSYQYYILGLLYFLNGDNVKSEKYLQKLIFHQRHKRHYLYVRNFTSALAWYDINEKCNISENREKLDDLANSGDRGAFLAYISKRWIENESCFSDTTEKHIEAVYNVALDKLTSRIFYKQYINYHSGG